MKEEKVLIFKVEKLGERIAPSSTGFDSPDIGRTRSATNFLRPALCALGLVVGFTVGAASPAAAQPRYTVHDLGTLGGGPFVGAKRINNVGQVVGTYATGSAIHGFRTAANSPLNPATDDVGVEPSCYSSATGINDAGQVTGFFTWGSPCPSTPGPDLAYANRHAFRTAPNSAVIPATDVIVAGGSLYGEVGTAINLSGQTAVFTVLGDGPVSTLAYRSTPNGVLPVATTYLGTLDPGPVPSLADSIAYDINDVGQVVGSSSVLPRGPHAFRTAPNSPINPATDDLGTLGGSFSYALGINSSGQAVGFSYPANDTAYHAFRTAPNSPINSTTDNLGTLSGFVSSFGNGINRSGQVVGCSDPANGYFCTASSHAFLYTSGVMYDLNGLIPANSGWTLQDASGINDLGQIVGKGVVNGATHAFRLDPASASFASLISSLIDTVKSLNLPPGIRKNLIASLQASLDAMARGNTVLARNQLKAFMNQVNAQIGKNLTTTQANTLLSLAAQAMQMLS